jgi:hypothetical protein
MQPPPAHSPPPAELPHRALARALASHCGQLEPGEREALDALRTGDWAAVRPGLLGAMLERGFSAAKRHAHGAHYTSAADIMQVLGPTIVQPWQRRIAQADGPADLALLHGELLAYRVLDPACGNGDFLVSAFEQLRALEARILEGLGARSPVVAGAGRVGVGQLMGFDLLPIAAATTRVALAVAQLRALSPQHPTPDVLALLRSLEATIRCGDALLEPWPEVQAVVGNPPFLDARKLTTSHGHAYRRTLRRRYPQVPGRADYCVYFFRRAHDHLPPGGRAGLVGTNTVRENYSREGGLDHVVATGGTITDAVATQAWSGDASVHVSIVNWVKGPAPGPKRLRWQDPAGAWHERRLERIPSSLTHKLDVSAARALAANRNPKRYFEGIQPGHRGFTIRADVRAEILVGSPAEAVVLHGYVNGQDLLTDAYRSQPKWLIDMCGLDLSGARSHPRAFAHLQHTVLPTWTANAHSERARTDKTTGEHQRRLAAWWQLKRRRGAMLRAITTLPRYIACARVTKRPIFVFVDAAVFPDSAVSVFAHPDDYSFGVLQSGWHWAWFTARCSTLEERFRYTSSTVWDSFPWPQAPSPTQVTAVASAARSLRTERARMQEGLGIHLRELYRRAEQPGATPLSDAQRALDGAVAAAYGASSGDDPLSLLMDLNLACVAREAAGETVRGPGLPPWIEDAHSFVSEDCVRLGRG